MNSTASSQTQDSQFEKVGQWLFFTRSALGWVAAFFCALTVAYLSLVFALPYLAANMFGMLSIFLPSSASMSIIPILLAFIFCPLLFIPGLAVGRFLLRSFPPRLSGKRRRWLLGYLIIMTIFWIISMGIGIFGSASEVTTVNNPAVSGFQGTKVPTINFPESSNFYRAARLFDSALYKCLQFMSALFWWFGFAIPLFQRHWTPHKPLEKPFVLFLRRFSTFADRSVNNALLKVTPAGKPVAFLTATQSRAKDWNPFQVGFSGIKIRKPFLSMPIILRSTNENWKNSAAELIRKSEKIVMDLSEGSGAIQTEIDMIEQAGRWPDTIILITAEIQKGEEHELTKSLAEKGVTIIKYNKSWWKAIPRLLFGLPTAGLFSAPLFLFPFIIALAVNAFMEWIGGAQAGLTPLNFLPFDPASKYILVVFVLGWFWLFYVFFVHPTFSKKAKQALKNALRGSTTFFKHQQPGVISKHG